MVVDVPVGPQLQQAEWSLDFRKGLTVEVEEGESELQLGRRKTDLRVLSSPVALGGSAERP